MSEIVVKKYVSDPKALNELKEIFFESSARKEFSSEEEKEAFYWKYLGFYLVYYPDLVLVAEGERILGYILGMGQSNEGKLYKIQPHMKLFQDYYQEYPAHLHINCHASSRGQGIGSKLLQEFEKLLQARDISGLHIMTSPDSVNRSFYKKLGFNFQVALDFSGSSILLMGKRLK